MGQTSQKKVLILITELTWGGAQRYVYDLSRGLVGMGYAVEVGGGSKGELCRKLAESGIPCHEFKNLVRPVNPRKDIAAIWEMGKYIKDKKFDFVHSNSSKAGVIGSVAGRLAGCPRVIFTAHGFVFNEKITHFLKFPYALTEMFASLFRDKIIAVSEYDKRRALKYHIAPQEKISVIYNGVDEAASDFLEKQAARDFIFEKIAADKTGWEGKKIIGCIANFYKNKGLKYLLNAAAEVKGRHAEAVFALMGEGKHRPALEKQIKDLRIDDTIFLLGFVDSAEKYLKGFDIYVCPSLKEGLPYTLIEALYADVPIVSTDVGGIPEIITDEESGMLVKPKNSGALAMAISNLLDNPHVAAAYAEAGREAARKFRLSEMVEKTIEVYNI